MLKIISNLEKVSSLQRGHISQEYILTLNEFDTQKS